MSPSELRCVRCEKPILPADRRTTINRVSYHDECFEDRSPAIPDEPERPRDS